MSRVQSIERAFAVLGALADGPIGVTEVSDRVQLPKSTAARLLASLAREGAVEQVPGGTRYRLGPRVATLAAAVAPDGSIVGLARPFLTDLASNLGEAAGLSVPEGFLVHYVDQVDSVNPVQVRDWTGTRAPMHAVSSGQVFLASLDPELVDRYLREPLEALTPSTLTEPAALRARIREVRADGYSWVKEEFAQGISSVAAPIGDASGEVIAAIHVHGPSYRFPATGTESEIGRTVAASANRLSARLRSGGARART
jgi:IclR family acetate operon transcriptional repressor